MGPEDVEADGPIGVDVGVVDAGREGELGRLEGVVSGEVDVEEKYSACKLLARSRSSNRFIISSQFAFKW